MNGEALLLLTLAVPLAGAALIGALGRYPNLREAATLATALALLAAVLALVPQHLAGVPLTAVLAQPVPGIALALQVEPLGLTFACVAAGLWIATSIYSIGYMRGNAEAHQTRFYVCFAIALSSTMGVAFAANLFTLFLFYEVLTLSTYPLVTHHGDEESVASGRTYLGLLLGSSIVLFLLAILVTWSLTGTLDFTPGGILQGTVAEPLAGVLLLLYVYGIGKAALMPIHRWLPAAMVAPTPVSALLHAVAVVKAGVFTVVKVAVYIFGIDYVGRLWSSDIVLYIAGFTILAASIIALRQDNLKRRLAYSTVSQLSYVILGAMLGNAMGAIGGGMHIVMHAFGKITLFFCAGAIYTAAHKTRISELNGIGRAMPITFAAFFVAALSIIGLPPLGGTWSKFFLAMGAASAGQYLLIAVLMVSSLLNVVYLLGPVVRAFFYKPEAGYGPTRMKEAPTACLVPIVLTAAGCVVLFFYAGRIYDLLLPIGAAP